MSKDVFISYKNDGMGNLFADRLATDLKVRGYSVFCKTSDHGSGGDFPDELRSAVSSCRDLILIVSDPCLDQLMTHRKVDWVREELIIARAGGKNIVPLLMNGVRMPEDHDEMPEDLRFLPKIEAVYLDVPPERYDESPLDALLSSIDSIPRAESEFEDVANSNPHFVVNKRLRDLLERADSGDYEAMYLFGLMCFYNFGVDGDGTAIRDLNSALYYLRLVVEDCPDDSDDHRLIKACSNTLIAKMYYQGNPLPQSYENALEHLSRAAELDHSAAMSVAYQHGIALGCEWDYEEAEELYVHAGTYGDFGLEDLASFYEARGDFKKAEQTYLKMDNLSAHAHYRLGLIYRNGSNVAPPEPSYEKACLHFQAAREKGHVNATYELGNLYFKPVRPFRKNFNEAARYFKEAADAGNKQAQYVLGYMLEYGHVERNLDEAIYYLERAASRGHVLASGNLARLYQISGHRNYRLAYKHCSFAAQHGNSQAEFMLGNLLLLGRGCEANLQKARHWYERARDHGFAQAHAMLCVLDELEVPDHEPSWLMVSC